MACEVCEHCDSAVRPGQGTAYEGRSYHQRCYKCYVCSATNLRNAEIFKGVIFCKNCSLRIFQDLSTARKKIKPKRKRNENRVLEMALNIMSSSDKSSNPSTRSIAADKTNTTKIENRDKLKKNSNEQGTTTVVTAEILNNLQLQRFTRSKPSKKRKRLKVKKSKTPCSDLRIAELGKSTEIAQMMLRKSEMPVLIKSDSPKTNFLAKRSHSFYITEASDSSGNDLTSSFDSNYSQESETHWLDRRIGSIIKLPYMCFKKKILERSALVSATMNHEKKRCVFNELKTIFNEEIRKHQRQGLEKLFSTINRKSTPNKLGWIEKNKITDTGLRRYSCKHFRNSHSYRCMRKLVMQRAGPTNSQLRIIRQRIKNFFLHGIVKGTLENSKKFVDLFVMQV